MGTSTSVTGNEADPLDGAVPTSDAPCADAQTAPNAEPPVALASDAATGT